MEITGTVTFVDLEGGFWGIEAHTGKRYALSHLPEAEQWQGKQVRATVTRVDGVSIRMWGIEVDLVAIVPLSAVDG